MSNNTLSIHNFELLISLIPYTERHISINDHPTENTRNLRSSLGQDKLYHMKSHKVEDPNP